MIRYIAKPDTWFDAGTEAIPVTEFVEAYDDPQMTIRNDCAVFRGVRNGQSDEETCSLTEFEIRND